MTSGLAVKRTQVRVGEPVTALALVGGETAAQSSFAVAGTGD